MDLKIKKFALKLKKSLSYFLALNLLFTLIGSDFAILNNFVAGEAQAASLNVNVLTPAQGTDNSGTVSVQFLITDAANDAVLDLPMHDKAGSTPFYTSNIATSMSGSQLFVDADMEGEDTSGWGSYTAAVLSKEVTSPHGGARCLRVYHASANVAAYQVILTTGVSYRITGWARSDGVASPAVWKQGAAVWSGTTSTDWQYFDKVFTSTGTTIYMYKVHVGDSYVEFDDVNISRLNGAILGAGAAIPTKLSGMNGYSFDGGDYLLVSGDGTAADLDEASAMTLAAWIKVSSAAGSTYPLSLPEVSASDSGSDFLFNDGNFEPGLVTHGGSSSGSISQAVDLDNYHFYTSTYDGTTFIGYVDGVEIGTESVTIGAGIKHASGEINIGRFGSLGANSPNGTEIHDVRVYDRALSPAEVTALFNQGNNGVSAKIEYSINGGVDYYAATLSSTDSNTWASLGDPDIDNVAVYQVGTTDNWIVSGTIANTVSVTWLGVVDESTADVSNAVIKITPYDGTAAGTAGTSSQFVVDNVAPAGMGSFTYSGGTSTTAALNWVTASESNFDHYEIWYGTSLSDVTGRTGTALEWDSVDDAAMAFVTTSTTTLTGLSAGLTYYADMWALDSFGAEISADTISFVTNRAPTVASISIATSTNGLGGITIGFTVDDADDDDTLLAKVEYSFDGGSSWASATIDSTSVSATYGSPGSDNDATYQVGSTSAYITTSSGPNIISAIWSSATDDANVDTTSAMIRITPYDGISIGTAGTSSLFSLDNADPGVLAEFGSPTSTATTIDLAWTAATDSNFANYEVWYGISQSDVQNRTGDSVEWDNDDDVNLATATTNSTTITGLSEGTTYYAKIWAKDTFGNETTLDDTAQTTGNAPALSSISASQATDGTGDVNLGFTVDDANADDEVSVKVEYSHDLGETWTASEINISSITSTYGTPVVDNNATYQIGTTSGYITTSSGANAITSVWSSANDDANADTLTGWVRLTPYDSVNAGTATIESFIWDNASPGVLAEFGSTTSTASTIDLAWVAATDSNFSHYEVWYGADRDDVLARSGTAVEWDNDDDGTLATATTAATTITGLTGGTTYYLKVWAVDNLGNETTLDDTAQTTTNRPVVSVSSVSENVDGTGDVDMTITVSDVDGDDNSSVKIEYSIDSGGTWAAATLTETADLIVASYGTPIIDNNAAYQVGTTGGYVITSSGDNNVSLIWTSALDVSTADVANALLRFTAYDSVNTSSVVTSDAFNLDNVKPDTIVDVGAGTYAISQTVLITAYASAALGTVDTQATVFYTTDGTEPTTDNYTAIGTATASVSITQTTTLRYYAVDDVGYAEVAKNTQQYNINSVPVITILSPEALLQTSVSTMNVEGTITDSNEVSSVYVNDLEAALSGSDNNKSFVVGIPISGDDGTFGITIIATNSLGDTASSTRNIIRDTTAPTDPVVTSTTSATSNASFTVEGTKEAGSGIYYEASEVVSVGAETTWEYLATLSAGLNELVFTSKDTAGNESGSDTFSITLDTGDPTVSMADYESETTSSNYTFSGTTEVDAIIYVNGVAETTADGDGAFSFTMYLGIGNNLYEVYAEDTALNTSEIESISIVRNNPLTAITISPSTKTYVAVSNEQTFTATGTYLDETTDDVTSTVTWVNDNDAAGTISSSGLFSAIGVGLNSIYASYYESVTGETITSGSTDVEVKDPGSSGGGGGGGTSGVTYYDASEGVWLSGTPPPSPSPSPSVEPSPSVLPEISPIISVEPSPLSSPAGEGDGDVGTVISYEELWGIVGPTASPVVSDEAGYNPAPTAAAYNPALAVVTPRPTAISKVTVIPTRQPRPVVLQPVIPEIVIPAGTPAPITGVVITPIITLKSEDTEVDLGGGGSIAGELKESAMSGLLEDEDGESLDTLEDTSADTSDMGESSKDEILFEPEIPKYIPIEVQEMSEAPILSIQPQETKTNEEKAEEIFKAIKTGDAAVIPVVTERLTVLVGGELLNNAEDISDFEKDTDGDGLSDVVEELNGSNPFDKNDEPAYDDGLPAVWKKAYGVKKIEETYGVQDSDGDGVTDKIEAEYGTNPTSRDTDGDGISDSEEIFDYGTNPIRETRINESLAKKPVKLNVQDGTYYKSMNSVFTGVAPYGARVMIYTQDDKGVRQLIGETVAAENNKFILSPEKLPQGKYKIIVQTLVPKDQAEKFENIKNQAEKRKNEILQSISVDSYVNVVVTDEKIYIKFGEPFDLNSAKKFVNIKYQGEDQKYVPRIAGIEDYYEYWLESEGEILDEFEEKVGEKDKETLDELKSLMVIPYSETFKQDGKYKIELIKGLKSINGELIIPATFRSGFEIEEKEAIDDLARLFKASVLEVEDGYISYETDPIEIYVDDSVNINEPDPKKISDIELTTDHILKGVKITVTNNRPIIEGVIDAGENSEVKVVAHWKSLLLTSALIADTSKGDFRIYAPENLEGGEHQVYLYAVKKDNLRTLRSKDIIVNFEVPGDEMPLWIWLAIAAAILAAVFAYFLFREKNKHPARPAELG